jgi:hypothetical protein
MTEQLKELMRNHRPFQPAQDVDFEQWLDVKIPPEAEAALVVVRERSGEYHVISDIGESSPSWFISATSIINVIDRSNRITWQPEAFLAFVGTLVIGASAAPSTDHAFEVVLWSMAQSGLNPLAESTIATAFRQVIDEARLRLEDQRQALESTLGAKYGESPESILARLPPSRQLLATLQIDKELVQTQADNLQTTQVAAADAMRRASAAESELDRLGRLRRKLAERQALAAQRKRKAQASRSSPKSKKRKRPK